MRPSLRFLAVLTLLLCSGAKIKAQWYDPREGTWTLIGQYLNKAVREFVPPSNGDQNDSILVLEDMEKNYPSS